MSNTRYSNRMTDEQYLEKVIKECQDKIDSWQDTMEMEECGDCYDSEGMKDVILDYLDELKIYPDDIDRVMNKLDF